MTQIKQRLSTKRPYTLLHVLPITLFKVRHFLSKMPVYVHATSAERNAVDLGTLRDSKITQWTHVDG
jgi:hypothetical protein